MSVTFRKLTPSEIIGLVKRTALRSMEWGGDVHVPHGDVKRATEVARMTRDAGLEISAYGSYYRVGSSENDGLTFKAVLDSAVALNAPVIRVWAGRKGSRESTDADWNRMIEDGRKVAEAAAATGRVIALEFHHGTLTDTAESCLRLLKAIDHPAARTYWQPQSNASLDDGRQALKMLFPWLSRVHIVYWEPSSKTEGLSAGADRWIPCLRQVQETGLEGHASIEFVRDASPEVFLEDAKTLIDWLSLTAAR